MSIPINQQQPPLLSAGDGNGDITLRPPAAAAPAPSINKTPNIILIEDHQHYNLQQQIKNKSSSVLPVMPTSSKKSAVNKYMECLKNHAAAIGGNATDGCGEFMAGGGEGTLEALKCSACNCHRNFHRKILVHTAEPPPPPPAINSRSASTLNKSSSVYGAEVGLAAAVEGGDAAAVKKRFRTKFSQEQKEKMAVFAEKGGWKIQKMDDGEVRRFCQEIGIKRKVLKVWMHNNKYHLAKKNNTTNCK